MTAEEGRWDEVEGDSPEQHYDRSELEQARAKMEAEKHMLDQEEDLFKTSDIGFDYQEGGEQEEDEGWGSPEETAKDIYDLGHPKKIIPLTSTGMAEEPQEAEEYDPIGEPDIFDTDGQKFIDMFGQAEDPEEAEEDVSVGGPPAGDTIPANGLYIDDEEEIPAEEAKANEKTCPVCDGKGKYFHTKEEDWYTCPKCGGDGEVSQATEEQIGSDTYYYDYSDYWKKGGAYQRAGLALQAGIPTDLVNSEWDDLPPDIQGKIRDAGYVTSYEATEGQGGTYGRSDFMLNPQHEDITTCVVCGRNIDDHSNPNTDYRGMSGTAPATDHYFLGGDQGGSDDKYDFESIATESEWRVHTLTHGEIPITLGEQADEIDAVNSVKRMYFPEGFIPENEILSVVKIGESLHGYGKEEVTDEEDIELLSRLLDNELEEEEQGDDETEDIALIAQLLGEEEFKEEEHPRDGGKFTTKGGGDSGGKHSKMSDKDIVKSIKGGSKDWHDWGRNEKTEDAYAEIERRNREIPTPKSKLGDKVFRDDPEAVPKMEQKVKYWEDQKDYWNKIIKFPHRDYQTHNQLGDARWFMGTNISTNLRDAKKKLEGIKTQQGRGTDLVRKPTYKGGKKRFYYSEEPKGEPPEEPWQKGGESYAKEQDFRTNCTDGGEHIPESGASVDKCTKCGKDIFLTGEGSGYWFTNEDAINWDSIYNESLKKNEAFDDSDRPVSPNTLMRYTEPIDLPTGKNAMDQTYGVSEPETPDGQDLTGITVGEAESEYDRIRGLIEMSEMPETVEDVERWAVSWGADKDLVKRVFDQEFGTYEGDEEIIEKKPFKPTYLYYKQYPFGRRAGKQNPFGEATPKIFQTFNSLQGATEQVSIDTMNQAHIWWDNKYPERQWSDMRIGERQDAILAFLRDPTTTLNEADTGYSCPDCGLVFGDGEEERKNLAYHREEKHGVPVDPNDSFGYEGGQGSGRYPRHHSTTAHPKSTTGSKYGWKNYGIDDYLDKAEKDYKEKSKEQFEDPTPWVSIGKMALDTAKDVLFPSDEQAGAGGAGGAGAGGVSAGGNGAGAPTGNGGEPPVVDGNGEDKEEEPSRRHGILYGYNKCPEGKVYRDGKCVEEADEDHQFSDMTDKEMEELGDYEGHPHQAEEDGLKDAIWAGDSPLPFADFITNVIDKIGGEEDTPMNAGKVNIKKVAKNKTLITPAEEGGRGSGKKDHKGWMRAIEEEHTYDFCENCSMITEQVNHKCDMCGKQVE